MRALSFRDRLKEEWLKLPRQSWLILGACVSSARAARSTFLIVWSASLEVPQRNRMAGTFRRLSKLMTELGWSAVRVRDFNGRGYKEQIRGYCRGPLRHA